MTVTAQGDIPVTFNSGTSAVVNQPVGSWKYFKFTVPVGALGWDLRLTNVTAGNPQMVVTRDVLPTGFTKTEVSKTLTAGQYTCGITSPNTSYQYIESCNNWPSGASWAAAGDLTGRAYTGAAIAANYEQGRELHFGMGSPLEPGVYYVGVQSTTVASYTLQSRAIGIGNDALGVPWSIQVQPLAWNGGTVAATGLAPREIAYYKVTVPAGTQSWSLQLDPAAGHEAMLAIHQGSLPNIAANINGYTTEPTQVAGVTRQKAGSEYFYKLAGPNAATNVAGRYTASLPLTAGDYYVAVVSEGQNPPDVSSTTGTLAVNYTLTSQGVMPVADKTATPLSTTVPVNWLGETALYGQQKVYRFNIPAGLLSAEVRLNNVVGTPNMSLYRNSATDSMIPAHANSGNYGGYYANEGGVAADWHHASLITLANPVAGVYTLVVGNEKAPVTAVTANTSYDVMVSASTPLALAAAAGSNAATLLNNQSQFYRFDIPASFAAWRLSLAVTNGAVQLRARKDTLPDAASTWTDTLTSTQLETILTPGFLTPGVWYVEVKATGLASYTLTSDQVTPLRTWTMPAVGGLYTQAGLVAPAFGDSGIDDTGVAIVNPNVGGQGIDLAQDHFHFYKVVVPPGNGALLRTQLDALSGDPDIYLRYGAPPSFDHAAVPNYNQQWIGTAYDRMQTLPGTQYANWVPLDSRAESQLKPGDWWVAVRGKASNVRYRLHLSTGTIQDLAQAGGAVIGHTLAAGDMRYYRVQVPNSDVLNANSTPLSWTLMLTKQAGDVTIFVRDTLPSGNNIYGDWTAGAVTTASYYFQDWSDDNVANPATPYPMYTTVGANVLTLPPVKPGKTYYLGVFAKTDAIFDLSSSIGLTRLQLDGLLPFAGGTVTTTVAVGATKLYRVDVPANAVRWNHTAIHTAGVKVYIQQDTIPTRDAYAHWHSTAANQSGAQYLLNQDAMNGYPWQPGHSYYVLVENTSPVPEPFTFTLDGRFANNDTLGVGAQTLTFAATTAIMIGGTGTVSATSTSYYPVILTSTTPAICTITGNTVTGLAAGACIIAANQPGNASFSAAAQVTQTITIGTVSQTLSFAAAPVIVVGGSGVVSATGGASGNAVIFSNSTPAICTLVGSTVTGVAPGVCTITANQAGNANFPAAAQVVQNITVGLGAQTVIFGAAPVIQVGGTGSVAATGGASGNAVTFTATTPTICTISGSLVTGVANGVCTIVANQSGNTSYNAAAQVTQSITISIAPPTAVIATAGNGQVSLSWTASVGATSYKVYWSTLAGFTTLTAQGSTAGIAATSAVVSGLADATKYYFIVTAVSAIGESAPNAAVGAVFVDGAESGAGLWTADAPWGTTTAAFHGGTTSFTDSPLGNYANSVNTSLTLALPLDFSAAVNPVLTFWHQYATEANYDNGYVEVSTDGGMVWSTALATYTGTLAAWTQVSINLSAYAGQPSVKIRFRLQSDTSIVADGWYVDDINITGITSQVSATTLPPPLTSQTLVFGAAPIFFSGGTGILSATGGASGNAVVFTSTTPTICTVTGSTVTGVAAGVCTIAANQAGNASYSAAAPASQNITVGAAGQSIVFAVAPAVTVGGTGILSATGGASGNPVVFTSTTPTICTVTGSTVTGVAAGLCTIAANQVGNASYSAAAPASQNITVSAVGLTLNLVVSWNLLGNSVNAPLTVATAFGNATNVATVWKWIPATSRWAFYTPTLVDGGAAYAATKGYDFMTVINGGEGFWVNAKVAFSTQLPAGNAISSSAFADQLVPPNSLPLGWSLIATGDNPLPRNFANAIALTPPVTPAVAAMSLTTLWAWDSVQANWYFYAPSLDNSAGLAAYITTKGYLNFGTKTLAPDMGFWVNHP